MGRKTLELADRSLLSSVRPRQVIQRPVLAIGLLLAMAVWAMLSLFNSDFAFLLVPLALSVAVLLLTSSRLGSPVRSPASVFAMFLLLNAVFGYLLADVLAGVGGASIAVQQIGDQERRDISLIFFGAADIVLIAAFLVTRRTTHSIFQFSLPTRRSRPVLAILLIGLSTAVVALLGPQWLLERSERFGDAGGASSLAPLLALVAVIISGVVFAGSRSLGLKILGVAVVLAMTLVFFSLASRFLALTPLLFAAGVYIGGRRGRPLRLVLVALAAAVVLFPLPLTNRALSVHGILPYAHQISSAYSDLAVYFDALNNILVGFRIVGITAFESGAIPASAFMVSISPGLGGQAGWYEVSQSLRVNTYTPFAAIGEIANQGLAVYVCSFLVIGLILGLIQNLGLAAASKGSAFSYGYVAIVGLTALFAIQSTQYNLRSDLRLLYYSFTLSIVLYGVSKIRQRPRRWPLQKNSFEG